MSTNSKLESYLTTLNERLGAISVSDRSEIIMEIKSHVMDKLEQNQSLTVEDVLKDLGDADKVAQKYLDERGIKVAPVKKTTFGTFVKWSFIVSATIMILLSLSIFLIVRQVSPLVNIKDDQVSILGGFIHVTDDELRIGDRTFSDSGPNYDIDGTVSVDKAVKDIKIKALNGRLEITESFDQKVSWNCVVDKNDTVLNPYKGTEFIELDLTKFKKVRCAIEIPAKLNSQAFLNNGRIDINEPAGNFDIDLKNGYIEINPKDNVAYNYDVKVERGTADEFHSAKTKDAYTIKAKLVNGRIRNGGAE